jgi:hypothetical protein
MERRGWAVDKGEFDLCKYWETWLKSRDLEKKKQKE